jgi:hypothetical protein
MEEVSLDFVSCREANQLWFEQIEKNKTTKPKNFTTICSVVFFFFRVM